MNILGKNVGTINNFKTELRQLEEKLSQYKSNVSDWNFEKGQHVKSFDEKRISNYYNKPERPLYRPIDTNELYDTIERADPSFLFNGKSLLNEKSNVNYLNDTTHLKNYDYSSKPVLLNKDQHRHINQTPEKRKSAKMQPNKASTIINADSWKNCEVLVNEHYKRIKHDIINDDHKVISEKHPMTSKTPEKQNKLLEKPNLTKPVKAQLIYDESTSKNTSMNRSAGYNQNEVRQYIELQKSKRIELNKNQKEKMKNDLEKQTSKIQAILRKQRENKIRKEKSSDYNSNDKYIDQTLDKKTNTEIDNLLQNNSEFMREKFKYNLKDSNDSIKPFELGESSEPPYNPSNLNKHERLKNICNMAIDLQAKLQETSVNVFQLSTKLEKENLDENYLLNKKLNNDAINEYMKNSQNDFLLPEKKTFSTSFPSNYGNSKILKTESNLEPQKSLDSPRSSNNSPTSFAHNGTKLYVEKIEKPNWNLESDKYSFFILAKNKLKKNIAKIENEISTKETTKTKTVQPTIESNEIRKVEEKLKMPSFKESTSKRDEIQFVEVDENNYEEQSGEDSTVSSVSTLTNAYPSPTENVEPVYKMSKILTNTIDKSYEYEKTNELKEPVYDNNPKTKEKDTLKHKEATRRNLTENDKRDYSPSTLERMLNAGLNYLENLSNSTIQLEELDKVRCIGLAQNENVVLAHFLRNQQLEKDIIILKEKSSNEVNTTIKDNRELLSEIQAKLKNFENVGYTFKQKHKKDASSLSGKQSDRSSRNTNLETSTESFDSSDTIKSSEKRVKKYEEPVKNKEVKKEIVTTKIKESDAETISTETFEDQEDSMSTFHTTKKSFHTQTEDKYDNRSIDSDTSYDLNKSKEIEKQKSNKSFQKKKLPLIDSESEKDTDIITDIVTESKRNVSEVIEEQLPKPSYKKKPLIKEEENEIDESRMTEISEKKTKKFILPQKRILEKREEELELRRKRIEELISWKKKLDKEEKELEKKEKEVSKLLLSDSVSTKQKPLEEKLIKINNLNKDKKIQKKEFDNDDDIKTDSILVGKDETASYSESFATETKTANQKKLIKIDSYISEETVRTEEDLVSIASSKNETITDQSEIESKINNLKKELMEKKSNAAKLKRDLKIKNKNALKEKELKLKNEIKSYDTFIQKMKVELSKKELIDEEVSKSKSISIDENQLTPIKDVKTKPIDFKNKNKVDEKKKENIDTHYDASQNIDTNYDEDFSSDENKSTTISGSVSKKVVNQDYFSEKDDKDELKSTTSEISEKFLNDSFNKPDDDSSNETDSSTDTQILLLGKNEVKKIVEKEDEVEPTNVNVDKKSKIDEKFKQEPNQKVEEKPKIDETLKQEPKPAPKLKVEEKPKIDETLKQEPKTAPKPKVEEKPKINEMLKQEPKTAPKPKVEEKPKIDETLIQEPKPKVEEKPKIEEKNIKIIELQKVIKIPNADLQNSQIELDKLKPKIVNYFESTLINEAVDTLLQVRTTKIDKLEKIKVFENEDEDNVFLEPNIIDNETTRENIKHEPGEIPFIKSIDFNIPSIDLDSRDFNEDLKVKKQNYRLAKPPEFTVAGYTKENVSNKIHNFIDNVYWNQIENKSINLSQPFENNDNNSLKNNRSFDEMLFDLSGELVYDLYRENYEKNQPVSVYVPGFQLLLKKSFFKTSLKGPSQKSETSDVVFNKIKDILNFPCKTESKKNLTSNRGDKKSKWRVQKRLDLVDNILDREMREEENEWSMYDQEEVEAKLMMSEIVFDNILQDTVSLILRLKNKKS